MSSCSNMAKMARASRPHTDRRLQCAGLHGMDGLDKQGQLSGAVEQAPCTPGTLRCGQVQGLPWAAARRHGLGCVLFGSTRQSAGSPHSLPEQQMHKGPLIGHPLPLQRKRMCQRRPPAAWPPGRRGIRRPKRPSSHCGAGPGCTAVEREPKTPLASLGGPCETSTLATLVRRPPSPTCPLRAAHHHLGHQSARHQQPPASGPLGDVHMLHMPHMPHAQSCTRRQPGRRADSGGHDLT